MSRSSATWLSFVAAATGWLGLVPALAQERLVSVYRADIPAGRMEIVLIDDAQRRGVGGVVFDPRDNQLRRLESTPREIGRTLLLNLLDGVIARPGKYNPYLPASTLEIRAYQPADLHVAGRLISLRTREAHDLSMGRSSHFSRYGRSSDSGEILQDCVGCPFLFKAGLERREDGDHHVTSIRVIDRIGGATLQKIDTRDIIPRDIETLTFKDFNGDGTIDFSMVPRVPSGRSWTGGRPHYYLFDAGSSTYVRSAELEQLRAQGYLEFPGGGRVLVKRDSRDPSPGIYRFTTPLLPVREPAEVR